MKKKVFIFKSFIYLSRIKMLNLLGNGSRCLQARNQQLVCPRISSLNHLAEQRLTNVSSQRLQSSLVAPAVDLPEHFSATWAVLEKEKQSNNQLV